MMRKLIYLFALAVMVSGCAGSAYWQMGKYSESMDIAKKNNGNMAKLKIGLTKEEAMNIMGNPDRTEAYQLNNKSTEYSFYRTHSSDENLNDIDGNFTPIAFQDNKVIGWGMSYYDKSLKVKQDINIK